MGRQAMPGQTARFNRRFSKQKGLAARCRKSFVAKVEAKGVEPSTS